MLKDGRQRDEIGAAFRISIALPGQFIGSTRERTIGCDQHRALCEALGLAELFRHPSLGQDHHAVAQSQQFRKVRGNQDNPDALLGQREDQFVDFDPGRDDRRQRFFTSAGAINLAKTAGLQQVRAEKVWYPWSDEGITHPPRGQEPPWDWLVTGRRVTNASR